MALSRRHRRMNRNPLGERLRERHLGVPVWGWLAGLGVGGVVVAVVVMRQRPDPAAAFVNPAMAAMLRPLPTELHVQLTS